MAARFEAIPKMLLFMTSNLADCHVEIYAAYVRFACVDPRRMSRPLVITPSSGRLIYGRIASWHLSRSSEPHHLFTLMVSAQVVSGGQFIMTVTPWG